ncbi:hypothetical protein BJV77DRAFT_1066329 [Russula vinacea]|nr:hypothetical protein BJV77DRAFT_1066329 [Russula vinacea]
MAISLNPLERILFTLLFFIIDEKEQHFANIDSIGDCVTSAERWPATDRNYSGPWTISTGVKKFMSNISDESKTEIWEREHQEARAQFYDDKVLHLEELRTTIKSIISRDSNRFPAHLQAAEASLESLQTAVINGSTGSTPEDRHNSNKYSGRGCSGDSEGSDPWYQLEDFEPTKSKPVWAAASDASLLGSLEQTSYLPQQNLGDLALPEAYVELIKTVGHIRRPFQ